MGFAAGDSNLSRTTQNRGLRDPSGLFFCPPGNGHTAFTGPGWEKIFPPDPPPIYGAPEHPTQGGIGPLEGERLEEIQRQIRIQKIREGNSPTRHWDLCVEHGDYGMLICGPGGLGEQLIFCAGGAIGNPVTTPRSPRQNPSPIRAYPPVAMLRPPRNTNRPVWKNPNGTINWPPNRGNVGVPNPVVIPPGALIDRYGHPYGTFVSPVGVPAPKRSLAPGTTQTPYNIYVVIKPVGALEGEAAPWGRQPGGGIQLELNTSVQNLLDGGYIRKVD